MFGISNNDLYLRMCKEFSIQEAYVRSDLRDTNRIVNKLNQNIGKNEEWLSDIANRLEETLANEKENQALKERIEKLEERIEELEKENRWFERRLKISKETSDNLIKILIKGD